MYFFKILNWYKHGLISKDELTKLLEIEKKSSRFAKKDFLSLRVLGVIFIFISVLTIMNSHGKETFPLVEAILALPVLGFIYFSFTNLSDDYQEQQEALSTKASLNEVFIVSAQTATKEKIRSQPSYYLTPKEYVNNNPIEAKESSEISSVNKPNKQADSVLGLILRLIIVIAPLPYLKTILFVAAFFPGVFIYELFDLKESSAEALLFTLMAAGGALYLHMFYRLFRIYFVKRT